MPKVHLLGSFATTHNFSSSMGNWNAVIKLLPQTWSHSNTFDITSIPARESCSTPQASLHDRPDSVGVCVFSIQPSSLIQVMNRAQWDEEQEIWVMQQLRDVRSKRPISKPNHRRPVTAYAQAAVALGDHNPRYKTDNILALALDMPDRTTADYSGNYSQTQVWASHNHVHASSQPTLTLSIL